MYAERLQEPITYAFKASISTRFQGDSGLTARQPARGNNDESVRDRGLQEVYTELIKGVDDYDDCTDIDR